MNTTYRPIAVADIEILVEMMQEFYAIDGYPLVAEVSQALFREFILDQNLGKAWLILHEGQIVGYVILTFIFNFEYGGKIAFVDELYIKEGLRGKSIGKFTMDFIQNQALAIGLKLLYLEVEQHNSAAIKLYRDKGFRKQQRNLMYYKIP